MMQFVTQSGRYLVISHGNGWAYEVTDTKTGDSVWAQDDDAIQMEQHTNKFENEDSINDYFLE